MTQAIQVRLVGSDDIEYIQEIVIEDGKPPAVVTWPPLRDGDKTLVRRFERTDDVVDNVRTYRELPETGVDSQFLDRDI